MAARVMERVTVSQGVFEQARQIAGQGATHMNKGLAFGGLHDAAAVAAIIAFAAKEAYEIFQAWQKPQNGDGPTSRDPSPEENPEERLEAAVRHAVELYKRIMDKECQEPKKPLSDEKLGKIHWTAYNLAADFYMDLAKPESTPSAVYYTPKFTMKTQELYEEYASKNKKTSAHGKQRQILPDLRSQDCSGQRLEAAMLHSVKLYERELKKRCDWTKDFLGKKELAEADRAARKSALELFDKTAKNESIILSKEYRTTLAEKIDERYQEYACLDKENGKRKMFIHGLFTTAATATAIGLALTPAAPVVLGLSVAGGLAGLVAAGSQLVFSVSKYFS